MKKGIEMDQRFFTGKKPDKCQLCGASLDGFVDGLLSGQKIWAYLCEDCHYSNGEGFGKRKGYLYKQAADGRYKAYSQKPFNPYPKVYSQSLF